MKPYKLEKLLQLNNKLAETSGSNFQVFARTLLSSVECEQSSELLPLVNQGDWNAVLACAERFATAEYRSPAEHRLNVQLASVFRKYPYPAGWLNTNPREKALQTFVASEHKCKRVNQRFIAYRKVRSRTKGLYQGLGRLSHMFSVTYVSRTSGSTVSSELVPL